MDHFLLRNECTVKEQIKPIERVSTDNLPLCSNSIVNMPFEPFLSLMIIGLGTMILTKENKKKVNAEIVNQE